MTPQSPPDHERGHQPLEYIPKSPVYPSPDDSCYDSSIPDLETPREQEIPKPEMMNGHDNANNMEVPADVNADKDFFQDTDRQHTIRPKLSKELDEAPSSEDIRRPPLTDEEKISKSVNTVPEDRWSKDRELFLRLSEAAKKLEESQP